MLAGTEIVLRPIKTIQKLPQCWLNKVTCILQLRAILWTAHLRKLHWSRDCWFPKSDPPTADYQIRAKCCLKWKNIYKKKYQNRWHSYWCRQTDDRVWGDIWFIRLLNALFRNVIMESPKSNHNISWLIDVKLWTYSTMTQENQQTTNVDNKSLILEANIKVKDRYLSLLTNKI